MQTSTRSCPFFDERKREMTISQLPPREKQLISNIKKATNRGNIDNISRTIFYALFFKRHKEIRWALLASIVSRNAGWNMTDLESNWFRELLSLKFRSRVFLTYERANWCIFSDAYPQLLLYEYSKKWNRPLFHLLDYFHVSTFMKKEWERFWECPEIERLCTALIINEQHVIQKPVIEHPQIKKHVFQSLVYITEEHLHFSYVLFPTREGKLYGFYVKNFTDVKERIELGKKLAWLLYESDDTFSIRKFGLQIEHTGSRKDYERYLPWTIGKKTPFLRTTFPIVGHKRDNTIDWFHEGMEMKPFFKDIKKPKDIDITSWYKKKMSQLEFAVKTENRLLPDGVIK